MSRSKDHLDLLLNNPICISMILTARVLTVQAERYLDSRTLHMLLVRLEMTSCRISLKYLSTLIQETNATVHMTLKAQNTHTIFMRLGSIRNVHGVSNPPDQTVR